jgi:nucleoside-diphosphate-sugar epimerase
MTVIIGVTGASGFLGSQVAASLRAAGHDVRGFDAVAAADGSGTVVDLRDPAATQAAMVGLEGVVHLAGYPRAGSHSPFDTFTTNTSITFSVVEAALANSVSLIAFVSSVSVIGYPFYTVPIVPDHLPVDEAIDSLPQDAYGLSKRVGEEIITAAVLRSGGSLAAVSLRFPALHSPTSFANEMPETIASGKDVRLMWNYIDTRDAADAVTAVFARTTVGHEKFFLAAEDSFSERPTAELLAEYFPGVPVTRELPGFTSLMSSSAATDYLSFTPKYSWRSYQLEGEQS